MRCAEHGLATGPDGHCVLCRRPSPRVESPRRTPWPTVALALVAAVAVGSVVFTLLGRAEKLVATAEVRAAPIAASDTEDTEPAASSAVFREIGETPDEADEADELSPSVAPEPTEQPARPTSEPSRHAEAPPPSRVLVNEQALRAEIQRVPITMYTTKWCPACEHARRWMRANQFAFVERDVEQNSAARDAQRRLNPAGGVPTIDIDGRVLVGFSEKSAAQAIVSSAERRLAGQR